MNYRKDFIMKKILILLIAVMLAFSGCGKKGPDESEKKTETVTNITVEKAAYNTIKTHATGTGEIKPATEVAVSAKASGTVKSVNVALGDYVSAGQVVATIDKTDYQLSYNQALAGYNSATASYNNMANGTKKQTDTQLKQQVDSAQLAYNNALSNYEREKQMYDNNTNLVSAKNALATAQTNYNNTQSLFEMGAASQIELDNARTAYENAQAALTATENSLKSAIDGLKSALDNAEMALKTAKENYALTTDVVTPGNLKTAKAAVDSAKAALDVAQNALNNTNIKATVSGYVTSCPIVAGQTIAQGTPAVTIINSNSVNVEINVTESVISKISEGTEALISVSSANIENMPGTVSEVSPSKDAQTGMYTVKINVLNADGALKGGMFADVSLVTESLENILCVPSNSIITDKTGSYVYIAKDGKATKSIVETGVSDDNFTEILSGVKENDEVVVSGKEFITEEKNKVKIVTEKSDK